MLDLIKLNRIPASALGAFFLLCFFATGFAQINPTPEDEPTDTDGGYPPPKPNCEECESQGGSWSGTDSSCTFDTKNEAGSVFFSTSLGQAAFERKTNFFRNARVAGKNIDIPALATNTWNFQSLNQFYMQAPLTARRSFKIWIAEESITSGIYDPVVIRFDQETEADVITDAGDGTLPQVLTHDRFSDIQPLTTTLINGLPTDLKNEVNGGSGDGFLIRTWVAGEQGAKTTTYALPTASPLSYLIFYNPDSTGTDRFAIIHRYLMDETGAGTYHTESHVHESTVMGGNDYWILSTYDGLLSSGDLAKKTTLETTSKTNDLKFTRTREVSEAALSTAGALGALGVVSRTQEEFDNVGGLSRMVKKVEGYLTSETRTTLYGWYTTAANPHEFGKIRYIRYPDLSYEQYSYSFNTSTSTAEITIRTPWKDNLWTPSLTPPADSQCIRTRYTITATSMSWLRYQGTTLFERGQDSWSTTGSETILTSDRRYTTTQSLTTKTAYYLPKEDLLPDDQHLAGRIKWRELSDGTAEEYEYTAPNGSGVYTQTFSRGAGDSTGVTEGRRVIHVRDAQGLVTSETVEEFDASTSLAMNSWSATRSSRLRQLEKRTYNGDADDYEQFDYDLNCCGGPVSSYRSRRATFTETQVDILGRTFYQTITTGTLSHSYTTAYTFAGGVILTEKRHLTTSPSSIDVLVSKTSRHINGELISVIHPDRDNDAGTVEDTDYSYSYPGTGGREITITHADGGTEITKYFVDGEMKSITGSAVSDMKYDHGIHTESSGNGRWTKITPLNSSGGSTSESVTKYYDRAGRLFRTEFESEIDTSGTKDHQRVTYYSHTASAGSRGKVQYIYDEDDVPRLHHYDTQGREYKVEKAVPGSPAVVQGTVKDFDFASETGLGNSWIVTTSMVYGATTIELSKTFQAGDGYGSRTVRFNDATNLTTTTITEEPTSTSPADWKVTTTFPDGTISKDFYLLGQFRARAQYKTDGTTVVTAQSYFYDGLERIDWSYQPGNGYTYYDSYTESGSPLQITAPGSRVSTYTYDQMSRQTSTTMDGETTNTSYYLTGQTKAVWGDLTYARLYFYDESQRMVNLRTYRGLAHGTEPISSTPSYDETEWKYHTQRGWLTEKNYPGESGNGPGSTPDYSYSAAGRLLSRTDERGNTTNYQYTYGYLTSKTYSDSTYDLRYEYHPTGQLKYADQGTFDNNDHTDTFTNHRRYEYVYDPSKLHLDQEILTEYDTNGTTVLFSRTLEHGYEDHLRPETLVLKDGATTEHSTTYGYNATDGRFSSVTSFSQSFDYDYTTTRSLVETVTGPAHTVTNNWDSTRPVLVWKENEETVGTAEVVSKYSYVTNDLGQRESMTVTSASISLSHTTAWDYNARGELKEEDFGNNSTDDGRDRVFEYDSIGNRTKTDEGTLTLPGSTNYTADALNQYDDVNTNGTQVNQDYDLDGNMTVGQVPKFEGTAATLTWDAENRMSKAVVTGATIDYEYDYLGRRVKKTVSGSPAVVTRFVYNGWNLCAEYSGTSIEKVYTWGMDLSQSMQGAGGVGGLLMVTEDPGGVGEAHYFPTYDGNGNVTQYLDSTGEEVAHYEYDAFGNVVATLADVTSGPSISNKDFDHRFSTKYFDDETEFYYYGYRYYDPVTGRWPSRDPIWERGGINLYAMVGNDVVSWWDYLGLIDINFNPKGVDSEGKREGCMSEFAKNAPDSVSDMTVFGHGSPNGIRNDRDPSKPVLWEGEAGVKALADEIRNHQDWKDGKIKRVVLYSCETGRSRALNGQIPFAQKLADELGIVILAPNEILWCSEDGSSSVCCKLDSVYKDDKRPDPNRPGDWMKFEKGKDPIKGDPPSKKNLEDAPRIPQSKDPNP